MPKRTGQIIAAIASLKLHTPSEAGSVHAYGSSWLSARTHTPQGLMDVGLPTSIAGMECSAWKDLRELSDLMFWTRLVLHCSSSLHARALLP